MNAAGLLGGNALRRAVHAIVRYERAQLALSKAALTLAEIVAPVSLQATAQRTDDGSPTSHLLVIGTDELENAAAVLHAADGVTLHYGGLMASLLGDPGDDR